MDFYKNSFHRFSWEFSFQNEEGSGDERESKAFAIPILDEDEKTENLVENDQENGKNSFYSFPFFALCQICCIIIVKNTEFVFA